MRAACVIAVEKAKSSFEPMLEVSKPMMCCNDCHLYCNVTYYTTLLHSTALHCVMTASVYISDGHATPPLTQPSQLLQHTTSFILQ